MRAGRLAPMAACRLAQRELARRDARVFVLDADPAAAEGLAFAVEFPGRHVAWTGAAASLIGAAGGLALAGKVPLVNLRSTFSLIRACEQVRLDLCYHHADVKLFAPLDGVIEDLAVARSLPQLTVLAPADAAAAYEATLAAAAHPGPVYLRLPPGDAPPVYEADGGALHGFAIGRGLVLREGSDLTLVAAGAVVAEALAAAELLQRDGLDARVLDMSTIKPIDRELLRRAAGETGRIVTVEEHPVRGGLGGAVAEALGDEHPVPLCILGLPDGGYGAQGPRAELLGRCGLDAAGIAAAARRMLEWRAA